MELKEDIRIRYDLIGAYNNSLNEHPQKVIEDLGFLIRSYEGAPIGDCIIMELCNCNDDKINSLPEYVTIL